MLTTPRRRRATTLAGAFLALGAATPDLGAQTQAATLPPALRAEVQRLVDSARVPSVTIAVARNGTVLWEDAFGYADLEHQVPATPTTLYSLASISKPFTATAVMRLVEQGRIRLDEPVNRYLGGMRLTGRASDASGATVRRVLSHTSGLPLHYRFYYGGDTANVDIAQTIARYGILVFPPGAVYEYSNLGFGILGDVVAQVSGRSYESFMRDEVFRPLGLSNTTVSTGAGLTNAAVRYDDEHRAIPFYDFDHRGASAVWSSADELVRFGMFHLKERLPGTTRPIADSTIDLMHRLATPGDTVRGYGLGWGIGRDLGEQLVQHTGGMPGVATMLSLYPADSVVIVVLSNQSSGIPGRIATELAAAVLPPRYATALAERRATPRTPPSPFTVPSALRGEWRGTVTTYDGKLSMAIRADSARVLVQWGTASAPWVALDNASFRSDLLGGSFAGTMPTDDARRVAHVIGIHLLVRGDTMRGWAAAEARTETNDYSLSAYADLTRTSSTASAAPQ